MSASTTLLERTFFSVSAEDRSYRVESVDGEVPGFLRGTWYSNGPGRLSRAGFRYRNWLDGDGVVVSLRFDDDGVELTSRPVRSSKFRAEEAAGAPLFRAFGTSFPGDRLNGRGIGLESPVNVSVHRVGGTLLAFGEQGLPWELDPVTLDTRGRYDFGGRLNDASPFAAHPKLDPETGELFNFGISYSPKSPCLHLYRFDPGAELARRSRLALDAPLSIHDFCLAGRHAVFYLSPHVLDVETVLRAGGTVMEALRWEPERGSELLVASRRSGEEIARVGVDAGDGAGVGASYCLHLVNGFEAGSRLAVDVLELERPVYDQYEVLPRVFEEPRGARPVRYLIDVSRPGIVDRIELPYREMCDFPSVDPAARGRPYDDFWMLGISGSATPGCKLFDELVHARWSTGRSDDAYRAPSGRFLGSEPVFVADPSGDGGAVLCQELDPGAGEGYFLVFDAFDVARGPVARLRLRAPVRLGFHAVFDRLPGGRAR